MAQDRQKSYANTQRRVLEFEVGERKLENVELIEATSEKIKIIRDRLKATQDRQKSYADTRRKVLEIGDMVFLKVAPWKAVI